MVTALTMQRGWGVPYTFYLIALGQVKFHPASGSRSTLVLRDHPEDTSYWVEEKQSKSEIHFFKNYATNGYLGKMTFLIKMSWFFYYYLLKWVLERKQYFALNYTDVYATHSPWTTENLPKG